MLKNALVYRLEHWDAPAAADLDERLQRARFAGCGAAQPEAAGWVAPRGKRHQVLAERVAGVWVLKLAREVKAVPSSAVKAELETRLDAAEAETGRRPKGKAAKALKEEIVHALLPRAFPKRADTVVWIDTDGGWVWIGAGSTKRADDVTKALVEHLGGGLKLSPVQTALTPAGAMAGWLADNEAPAGFTIDRDCELKAPEGEKPAVRYARHALELPEIAEHVRQGKRPTRLALTWASRVSFELSETLALKKIRLTDAVLEAAEKQAETDADANFDADVALLSGELRGLWTDLLDALGGLQVAGGAAAETAAASAAAPADDLPPWEVARVA